MTVFVEKQGGKVVGIYSNRQTNIAGEEVEDNDSGVIEFRSSVHAALTAAGFSSQQIEELFLPISTP